MLDILPDFDVFGRQRTRGFHGRISKSLKSIIIDQHHGNGAKVAGETFLVIFFIFEIFENFRQKYCSRIFAIL